MIDLSEKSYTYATYFPGSRKSWMSRVRLTVARKQTREYKKCYCNKPIITDEKSTPNPHSGTMCSVLFVPFSLSYGAAGNSLVTMGFIWLALVMNLL